MKLMIVILLALFQTNLAQSELLKDPYLFYKSKKEYLCGPNMLAPYFGLKMPLKIEKLIINRNLDKALIEAQKDCFSLGLTTVDIAGLLKEDIELIEKLYATKELKIIYLRES